MKFLCDHCERLVEAGPFRTEGEALLLRCPRCEAESRVLGAAAAAPAESRPVVVPFAPRPAPIALAPPPEPVAPVPAGERCPKCAAPKNGREACAKCGLIFELYRPEADVIPQSARRDFARLLELQGTPEADRGLDSVGTDQVAHLARLARHHLADFPDDVRALALLDRLTARSLALAAAAAQSESLGRGEGSSRKVVILFAAGVALLGLLTLLSVLVRAS